MDELRDVPSDPVTPPRFRWRNIFLCILAVAMIIFGLARMSGGVRGMWGASHTPGAHR